MCGIKYKQILVKAIVAIVNSTGGNEFHLYMKYQHCTPIYTIHVLAPTTTRNLMAVPRLLSGSEGSSSICWMKVENEYYTMLVTSVATVFGMVSRIPPYLGQPDLRSCSNQTRSC